MALPMLVNGGADCGPSNPLQGLSKRFDQDRGIQQDYFGPGRASGSREVFRTASQAVDASLRNEAKAFFNAGPAFKTPQDLAVPGPTQNLLYPIAQNPVAADLSGWASSFKARQAPPPVSQAQSAHPGSQDLHSPLPQLPFQSFAPPQPVAHQPDPQALLDQFDAIERHQSILEQPNETLETSTHQAPIDADELSRTAASVLEAVKHEQNPKFLQSSFFGLMRDVRDRQVVVEGNTLVEASLIESSEVSSSWAKDFNANAQKVDLKGKGKAVTQPMTNSGRGKSVHFDPLQGHTAVQREITEQVSQAGVLQNDSELDQYFRQENEELQTVWGEYDRAMNAAKTSSKTHMGEWDTLQHDWDRFEATASGIKPVDTYAFQGANPYLLGEASRTHHHDYHSVDLGSVLEKEAAVQRDPTNYKAWFELGIKQQENEREAKAIQALTRAVELEPSYLDAWVALAISHTNESDRAAACNAIEEWVSRNVVYKDVVQQFRAARTEKPGTQTERHADLVECLMTMVRSVPGGEVDADTQVALAVLLNNAEDYERAQDCFRAALAVRPDDWVLYNRVGATLANSGRAEEALGYYYRALELNPGYIRARFNLGISCINLKRYTEAAQYILDALVLQENDTMLTDMETGSPSRGVTSSVLWDSLKTTSLHMLRMDLAKMCDDQDLAGFREEFSQLVG
ncbi:TPR-like protein [Sistotremastrum niveocremeum HHB9708]|uniref:TPR-like protein n=1 Tax=Sistotremastrum niveocremeum HHB9708 TaxID=1314777 RepID=A0A164VA26_9AGAM|nr:TPR-like protein [Sistotremastrum niveocremeum HHB9708]